MKAQSIKIGIVQANPIVGDIEGNVEKLLNNVKKSQDKSCDLLVFSELFVTGYPPEDLILRPSFIKEVELHIQKLCDKLDGNHPAIIVGCPWIENGHLYNSALYLHHKKVQTMIHKTCLPNYGVFDEKRVFDSSVNNSCIDLNGIKLGIMVCEDMWCEEVSRDLSNQGVDIFIVINGSPYEQSKQTLRIIEARERVLENELPLIYVNQVGGQDELVFDGASFVLDNSGEKVVQCKAWQEEFIITEWSKNSQSLYCNTPHTSDLSQSYEADYQALTLGLRDYIQKNNFPGVLIGLSGGIDSALSAAIAVDALGPEKVKVVMMSSPYTSNESITDAEQVADLLGLELHHIPIHNLMDSYDQSLEPFFKNLEADLTEENLQSRIRGALLMALSNKLGYMVLSTGNKSEVSTGYATLYGDMCGGYSVLKDIYKTYVFELSVWRNKTYPENALGPKGAVMPQNIISKPPSAELRDDQKDSDSLPPYNILDVLLKKIIEDESSTSSLVSEGYDAKIVEQIQKLILKAEYKRRQAVPGVKITSKSFGKDRRYPITNYYLK